jgi:hypothetical protein
VVDRTQVCGPIRDRAEGLMVLADECIGISKQRYKI